MDETKRARLEEIGRSYARSMFEDMRDPKNRGPMFSWQRFPDTVRRIASSSAFMYFSETLTDAEKDVAWLTAHDLALQLARTEGA